MCKNIFGISIYVRFKFSGVCSSYDLCACSHAHSLEGTLTLIRGLQGFSVVRPSVWNILPTEICQVPLILDCSRIFKNIRDTFSVSLRAVYMVSWRGS